MPSSCSTRLCLCGPSALSAWRRFDNSVFGTPIFGHTPDAGPVLTEAFPTHLLPSTTSLNSFGADFTLARNCNLNKWGISTEEPVHLLVSRDKRNRKHNGLVIHSWSRSVPNGSILQLDDGLFAVSPEFLFAQEARCSSPVDQMLLGMELTGCYAICPSVEGGLCQRPPLCSTSSIASLLGKLGDFHGHGIANSALSHIANGSGSPRESALFLILTLPMKLGGFGLPMPKLNQRLDLGPEGSILWGKNNAFDLVWEKERLIVEYDGATHEETSARERDCSRRTATLAANYTVLVITKRELATTESTKIVAETIARKLNRRLRFRNPDFPAKHRELRRLLLSPRA